ncbi:30S ribosomal protein S9 [Candidatus Micrarchaeota archaeon]|nr:30S ribosomal protein S9 [Candidatus Micrarchaeota archaeon]
MTEKKESVKKKARKKVVVKTGKRKEAVARATIRDGTGRVELNGAHLNAVTFHVVKDMILEPLDFIDLKKYDIEINVRGGGVMGQAQAARTAVAKALVEFSGDPSLRERMMRYDRSLLVDDPRRVEPKKFKGPKARARFTKSYR